MVDCKKKQHRGCIEGIQMVKHEMVNLDTVVLKKYL